MGSETVRYFYDFEFLENGETIRPISIGIAAYPGGRKYYAVFAEIDGATDLHHQICNHRFLWEHVVPRLPLRKGELRGQWTSQNSKYFALDMSDPVIRPKWLIANEVRAFLQAPLLQQEIDQDLSGRIELWADYGAYGHVALMQLWGSMARRPRGLPMWTHDLQQYAELLDLDPNDAPTTLGEPQPHNSLYDAMRLREQWEWIRVEQIKSQGGTPAVLSTGEVVAQTWSTRPVRDDPQA